MGNQALLKIPFVLLVTICYHIVRTAPSIARRGERLPVRGIWEKWVEAEVMWIRWVKGVYWSLGIAEILTIILTEIQPESDVTGGLLGFLVPGDTPPNIRLTPTSSLGLVFIVLGTCLRVSCYRTMGVLYTYQLSIRTKHKLITSGPYQIVRHPGYLALTLVVVGDWLWQGSRGSWMRESGVLDTKFGFGFSGLFAVFLAGSLAGCWSRIPREEAQLKKLFGDEWEKWAGKVRYKVLLGLY